MSLSLTRIVLVAPPFVLGVAIDLPERVVLDAYQQIIAGCSARMVLPGGAASYELHIPGSAAAIGLTPGADNYLQITPGS